MKSGETKSTKYFRANLFLFIPSTFHVNEVTFNHAGGGQSEESVEQPVVIASTDFVDLSDPGSLKRPGLEQEFPAQNHLQMKKNRHQQ